MRFGGEEGSKPDVTLRLRSIYGLVIPTFTHEVFFDVVLCCAHHTEAAICLLTFENGILVNHAYAEHAFTLKDPDEHSSR